MLTWWSGDTSEESYRLREALLDLSGDEPQTFDALAAGAREHWGPAESDLILAQLRELVRDGRLRRTNDGYVRVETHADAPEEP